MQEKKQLAKEGFSEWNTDGDDKYLTFEEFDAGMNSLGITKSKSISTVSLFYMEEDRRANQRSAFSLSLNIIAKHWKWIWTKPIKHFDFFRANQKFSTKLLLDTQNNL